MIQTIDRAPALSLPGSDSAEPLRVVHVVDAAEGDVSPWGHERAVEALMRVQRAGGCVEPELLCFSWGRFAAEMDAERFPVSAPEGGATGSILKLAAALGRVVAVGPVPVVHTHAEKANVLARFARRLMGARMRCLVSSYHAWERRSEPRNLYELLDRRSSGLSDVITVPDAATALPLSRHARIVQLAEAVAYAPPPMPYERAHARAVYGWEPDEFVVGVFDDFAQVGGALEVLAAARGTQDRGIVWAIAGGGEFAGTFKATGLKNVRVLGDVAPAPFFAAVDAAVQPSHCENLGPALLAAMRAGVPTVVTRVGAVEAAVTHDVEVLIVEPGDTEDLLQRITFLKRSPLVCRRLGTNARRRFETTFDIRFQHEFLLELYRYGGMKRV